jgi:hypothetical protein
MPILPCANQSVSIAHVFSASASAIPASKISKGGIKRTAPCSASQSIVAPLYTLKYGTEIKLTPHSNAMLTAPEAIGFKQPFDSRQFPQNDKVPG